MSKLALISGGGGTLAAAFAQQLASQGDWTLILADRDSNRCQQLLDTLCESTPNFERTASEVHTLDVTDQQSWIDLITDLNERHPRIDLLINTAAIASGGELTETPASEHERLMQINYFGTLYGCQAVLPCMKEQRSGTIINIASILGVLSPPTVAAYACPKAAVIALSESLYGELRPHGIGVTVAIPGFFASGLLEGARFSRPKIRELAETYTRRSRLTAQKVAVATLDAANRGKLYVVTGSQARWYWRAKRWAPAWLSRLLARRHATQNRET